MALTKSAINLIGRHHPAIFDILGNPVGPYARAALHVHGAHVALRPGSDVGFDPQPDPPGFRHGLAAAAHLVHLAFTSRYLRTQVTLEIEDWCPTPPPLPWPLGGPPPKGPQPDPWELDYNLGLAFALEASEAVWEGTEAADLLVALHERALDAASRAAG